MSKVTCIIFVRHLYRKGDAQQKCVTFVRVTLGCFLHSVLINSDDMSEAFAMTASENQL